jgi:hypothetical protein
MLIFLGTCGFVMQYLLTKGLAAGGRGNGARATNMIYTNMLFALALDKVVFGQSPGWWSLGGSGLILGSAIFVAVKKQQVDIRRGDEETGAGASGVLQEEEMAMLGGESPDGETEETQEVVYPRDDEAEVLATDVGELSDFPSRPMN